MGFSAVWCLRPCPKGVTQAGRPGNACHRLRPGHAVKSAVPGQCGKDRTLKLHEKLRWEKASRVLRMLSQDMAGMVEMEVLGLCIPRQVC